MLAHYAPSSSGARRSATTSTVSSTRSTTSPTRRGWASDPPRRAGPSRTSSRRSLPGPGSRGSTSRSGAPARCPRRAAAPVTVGGVVVSNATLHNEDYIAGRDAKRHPDPRRQGHPRRRLGAGLSRGRRDPRRSPMSTCRSGPDAAVPYVFPETCPECGSDAVREEGDSVRRCTGGLICPAQAVEKLKHFVSRAAFDIEGLGAKQIEAFHADGWIAEPADIFTLKARYGSGLQQLKNREGWGEKSAANLFDAIDEKAPHPACAPDLRARHPPCGRGRGRRPRAAFRQLDGLLGGRRRRHPRRRRPSRRGGGPGRGGAARRAEGRRARSAEVRAAAWAKAGVPEPRRAPPGTT
jgi:DNA ligase (NAD+)